MTTFQKITNIAELRIGDTIRHVSDYANTLVVTYICCQGAIAVRTGLGGIRQNGRQTKISLLEAA